MSSRGNMYYITENNETDILALGNGMISGNYLY